MVAMQTTINGMQRLKLQSLLKRKLPKKSRYVMFININEQWEIIDFLLMKSSPVILVSVFAVTTVCLYTTWKGMTIEKFEKKPITQMRKIY